MNGQRHDKCARAVRRADDERPFLRQKRGFIAIRASNFGAGHYSSAFDFGPLYERFSYLDEIRAERRGMAVPRAVRPLLEMNGYSPRLSQPAS